MEIVLFYKFCLLISLIDIKEGAEELKDKAHEAKEKLDEKLAEHKEKNEDE